MSEIDPHGEAETLRAEVERLRATNERLRAELDGFAAANHRQALCIHLTAQALGPDYAATVHALPKAAAHVAARASDAETERDALRAEGFASGWATAIEAAADYLEDDADRLLGEYQREMRNAATAVRALPVDEEAAAVLDRIRMDARVRGMRTAAHICARAEQETKPGGPDAMIFHFGFTEGRKVCERAILARAAISALDATNG